MMSGCLVIELQDNMLSAVVSGSADANIIQFSGPVLMDIQKQDMAALVARVSDHRDRDAFIKLYQYFAPRVKSFLMGKGLSEQPAEDVLQEAMLAVWQKAGSYKPEKAAVSTWIFTIARNKFIDLLRRDERRKESTIDSFGTSSEGTGEAPEFQLVDDGPIADEQVLQEQRNAVVRAALSRLPQDQQGVIAMSFIQGLAHGEIANILGLPLGTVKSRIRLGFKRMREEIGEFK
jgi:RNA polymerase sigma-70 factor (ECF subfamily)